MCFHFLIYSRHVLDEPENIDDGIGNSDWRLTISLLIVWVTIFLIVILGLKSIGKASYFLAIFPYLVMIVLLVHSTALPGAGNGVAFFFRPQWEKLLEAKVR